MALPAENSSSSLLVLEKELICFICTEVLYQPLTLIDCLHTFCGSCLKEWFSHQYKKARQSRSSSSSNPYTCPACRATVKDARHDARIATWLEMFLTAHPSKGRTTEERQEMAHNYKPGEDILPALQRNRRREHRHRREEDTGAGAERRMIDEARERSLQDAQSDSARPNEQLSAPRPRHQQSRSRERRREEDRAERRRRVEAAEAAAARSSTHNEALPTSQDTTLPPPSSSPRHPDAVEARQRERGIAHQASLRSLVSSSEEGSLGTGDSLNEARIMQEILAEGLLDGIDVDQLTEGEQDALSERIAEAYRRRHPRRNQRSIGEVSQAEIQPSRQTLQQERPPAAFQQAEGHTRQRSRSNQRSSHSPSRQRRDPVLQATSGTLSPPTSDRAHRRRASDQTRRQTSPAQVPGRAAARSSIDLSSPPAESSSAADPLRRVPDQRRTQTEPVQSTVSASEARSQRTANIEPQPSSDEAISEISNVARIEAHPPTSQPQVASPESPELATTREQDPTIQAAANIQQIVSTIIPSEPVVNCSRCGRENIQHEVHRHCEPCAMDLCLRCYRGGRGCNHWFGFGNAALRKFNASGTDRSSKLLEPPHLLVGRKFLRPIHSAVDTAISASSTEDHLEEGNFCDRCGTFANTCFWKCDYCNEGEWGFCNECVDTHRCCTHPLLPIGHRGLSPQSPLTQPPADYDISSANHTPDISRPSTSHSNSPAAMFDLDYAPLRINASCDMCGQTIPAAQPRYHCPSHISSTSTHNLGGYDICTVCYSTLVRSGRVKRDDGPNGWRKCPAGHRMVVLVFDTDELGHQRRIILDDLVGGWKCTDDDIRAWNEAMRRNNHVRDGAAIVDSTLPNHGPDTPEQTGRWHWHDDPGSATRKSRSRVSMSAMLASLASEPAATQSSFPPSGGFGFKAQAMWSYLPADGDDGKGEIMFPKNAELGEIEEINEDWWRGVYAGEEGLIYARFARRVS